jgi:hypothetical protein
MINDQSGEMNEVFYQKSLVVEWLSRNYKKINKLVMISLGGNHEDFLGLEIRRDAGRFGEGRG